jgi:GNAT superfamily N-acetyltransferase
MAQVVAFGSAVLGRAQPSSVPPGTYEGFGQAALAGSNLVGLLTGGFAAVNECPGEQLLYLYGGVHPVWRRRGIGRQLLGAAADECRKTGRRVTAIVNLNESQVAAGGSFLVKMDFAEVAGAALYERDLRGATPPSSGEEKAYSTHLYRGGDANLNAAIADLHRRAYHGRPNAPVLEDLEVQFANRDLVYLLVFDGGRLVGHASALVSKDQYFVESIQVARSHWGTGVSDSLAHAITRHAFEVGARCIGGAADATNRANRALMERHGLRLTELRRRYCRVFEGG